MLSEPAAQTRLDARCARIIDWLAGNQPTHPGHDGEPAPETVPLIDALTAVNRAGLLTLNSQPGTPNQRAYLDLVATRRRAADLAAAARAAGLLADHFSLTSPPEDRGAYQVTDPGTFNIQPAGTVDADPRTDTTVVTADADWVRGACHDIIGSHLDQDDELAEACDLLVIIDPHWGRTDLLWQTVRTFAASSTADAPAD